MKGKYIYICMDDQGNYVQPSRKVYPTRQDAEQRTKGVDPNRKPIVVEISEPVEVDSDYYPKNSW